MTSFLEPGAFPGKDIYHPLLDRSGHYYNDYGKNAAQKAKDWFDDSTISGSDGFLNSSMMFGAAQDGIGPAGRRQPASLPVKWTTEPSRPGDPTGFASGWKDDRQSPVSSCAAVSVAVTKSGGGG